MSTTRRSALGFSFAAMAAGWAVPALAAPPGGAGDDSELVEVCHRMVERELENWYAWEASGTDEDWIHEVDWDSYHRIMATPATTPAGWHAKALAFSVWDRDAYDNHICSKDPCSAFLANLLRDIVAPARNEIMRRLRDKFGPLPPGYTAEGVFVGYTAEELERRQAQRLLQTPPAVAPPDETPDDEWWRREYGVTNMTRERLEGQVRCHRDLQKNLATMNASVMAQMAENGWDLPADLVAG